MKINLFRVKKSVVNHLLSGQIDSLEDVYHAYADDEINRVLSEKPSAIDYLKRFSDIDFEKRHDIDLFFQAVRREANRNQAKKDSELNITFGGGGMSNRKQRKGNEEKLKAYGKAFSEYFDSRFCLMIRTYGEHNSKRKYKKGIFGGMRYQIIVVDAYLGETVFFKTADQGSTKPDNNSDDALTGLLIPKQVGISSNKYRGKLSSMLTIALKQYEIWLTRVKRRGNKKS
jgi:hypothetical protein